MAHPKRIADDCLRLAEPEASWRGCGASPRSCDRTCAICYGIPPCSGRYVVTPNKELEIHHLGCNYFGRALESPWRIYPNEHPIDVFALKTLETLMERLRPSLVLLLHDPWNIPHYLPTLDRYRRDTKLIVYLPVDGRILVPATLAWVPEADKVVAYTEFARQTIQECLQSLGLCANICVIPHGTSTDLFFPILDGVTEQEQRAAARKQVARVVYVPEDSFVVLNASRNQPRKRIDLTIAGFARFAKGKPAGVRLLLHMGLREIGWNIRSLAADAGILDRLIVRFSPGAPNNFGQRVKPDLQLLRCWREHSRS